MLRNYLSQLRRENHLSCEQLADRLHVSPQTVEAWETGEAVPDANEIILLSEVLQQSTDTLLGVGVEKRKEQSGSTVIFIVRSVFLMLVWISAFVLYISCIYADFFSMVIEFFCITLILLSAILFAISLICEKRRIKKMSGK